MYKNRGLGKEIGNFFLWTENLKSYIADVRIGKIEERGKLLWYPNLLNEKRGIKRKNSTRFTSAKK